MERLRERRNTTGTQFVINRSHILSVSPPRLVQSVQHATCSVNKHQTASISLITVRHNMLFTQLSFSCTYYDQAVACQRHHQHSARPLLQLDRRHCHVSWFGGDTCKETQIKAKNSWSASERLNGQHEEMMHQVSCAFIVVCANSFHVLVSPIFSTFCFVHLNFHSSSFIIFFF